jgi:Protein of unknown function (DUF732)
MRNLLWPIIFGLLFGTALFFSVPARADADDDADFLRAMHSHGITSKGGDSALISGAHGLCGLLYGGYTVQGLIYMGDLHERNGMSDDDVAFLVRTAVAAYCPEYLKGTTA